MMTLYIYFFSNINQEFKLFSNLFKNIRHKSVKYKYSVNCDKQTMSPKREKSIEIK